MSNSPSPIKEGNLEAPTRHSIDWQNPSFYDEAAVLTEMERIFDICHGCRRCLSLCNAFPTLFDLVDESKTGEIDGVDKADYKKVVDQCYLCDMCYMAKCPYTPPHPWNLDFPHTMLRAKAVNFKKKASWQDKLLSATDTLGMFAGIPIVTATINTANHLKPVRKIMEKVLNVEQDAWIPEYANPHFRSASRELVKHNQGFEAIAGERTPGKVVVYATCYINYNEPGIGEDLLTILNHNQIPFVLISKEACCGMPKMELGDLEAVADLKQKNIPQLAEYARQGYAILTPIPSCTLMYKQELPLLFPNDSDVQAVQKAMFDPFEYFVARNKDGLLKTDFSRELGAISYHIPCHGRVQNIGKKTEEVLKMLPGTTVNTVERCAGHSGTWGVKKEYHHTAMKIGTPVFKQMINHEAAPNGRPDWISSDCQLAGRHIEQGIEKLSPEQPAPDIAHPLTLLRLAYGL